MALVPVSFKFEVTDDFSAPLARAHEAAASIYATQELARATWEPHDWTDLA